MRLYAISPPRKTPWRETASYAYSEQLGWNLQRREVMRGETLI